METKKVKVLFCDFGKYNPNTPLLLVGDTKVFGTEEFKEKVRECVLMSCDDIYGSEEKAEFAKHGDAAVEMMASGKDASFYLPDSKETWNFYYVGMELFQ